MSHNSRSPLSPVSPRPLSPPSSLFCPVSYSPSTPSVFRSPLLRIDTTSSHSAAVPSAARAPPALPYHELTPEPSWIPVVPPVVTPQPQLPPAIPLSSDPYFSPPTPPRILGLYTAPDSVPEQPSSPISQPNPASSPQLGQPSRSKTQHVVRFPPSPVSQTIPAPIPLSDNSSPDIKNQKSTNFPLTAVNQRINASIPRWEHSRSITKSQHIYHPAIRPSQMQSRSRALSSERPSARQSEGSSHQNKFGYPTPPYAGHSVHQLPTPPQSQSMFQQPSSAYQNHSAFQQSTPAYQGQSAYQQHTPPYHNYPVYQPTPPQRNHSGYQPPTSYRSYPVYQQPTPPLHSPEQEPAVQGSYHQRPLLDQGPSVPKEAPDLSPDNTASNKFMGKLLQHTIIGAEFDSSDRYPPPRCHPRTRFKIIERCKAFVVLCDGKEKLRWVVGSAGVGKSAVMQTVAEETPVDVTLAAAVFLNADKRQDGTKMFTTIAYQLAAKSDPYRNFIRNEITRDPSLLRKSLPVQFNTFIIKPFIRQRLFDPSSRFLILIDGLDQCDNPLTQRDLLGLISYFCMTYPTSPIVWMISSRPEPHITSFFEDTRFAPAYTKEELVVDSEEARQDVRRYLHGELKSIQLAYPSLRRKQQWPSDLEFNKIASAAGGLFAYASTVVQYIGDPRYRGPGTQIKKVLMAIDAEPGDDIFDKDHPLKNLDALYDTVLSKVPDDILVDTRRLLLLHLGSDAPFRLQCNLLGLNEDAAYTAMGYMHSVVRVPEPADADDESLQFFHESFEVYLCNFKRSGFSRNVRADAQELLSQCSMRVVKEVSDHVGDGEDMNYDNVSLSWAGDDLFIMRDEELRRKLYQHAIATISPATISSTILSNVPDDDMIIARKLLFLRLYSDWSGETFRTQCNLLGFTEDAAYGALRNACSVVRVPEPGNADDEPFKLFHKSLEDHLSCFEQPESVFYRDVRNEVEELMVRASLRIVEEVGVDSDDMGSDEVMKYENVGYLRGGPGVSKCVSLSWPGGDHLKITDDELRLKLYSNAIANISFGFKADLDAFSNMSCFDVLTTRFTVLGIDFPYSRVQKFVFNKFRNELTERGSVKQVPLRQLDFAAICGPINLHYTDSTGADPSTRWNSSCPHDKEETNQGWSTSFGRYEEDDWSESGDEPPNKKHDADTSRVSDATEIPRFNSHAGNEFHWSFLGEECLWTPKQCNYCLRRLARCFVDDPDRLATVFVDSTELCYAELLFVDPKDGVSQWRYRFFHSGNPKM